MLSLFPHLGKAVCDGKGTSMTVVFTPRVSRRFLPDQLSGSRANAARVWGMERLICITSYLPGHFRKRNEAHRNLR